MKKQMYYDSNYVDFFVYKSMRKNAKCIDMVHCLHLIGKNGQISDDRILSYFCSKLDEIVCRCKRTNGIYISWYEGYCKPTHYINANNDYYEHNYMFRVHHNKEQYYSIEQFINEMYRLFMDIYPYSKIDIKTIYENPSIKFIIHAYYTADNAQ